MLSYDVDAQITGKIAQLGSRLIQGSAKMLAGKFFDNFEAVVTGPVSAEGAPAAAAASGGSRMWIYVLAGAVLALIAAYLFAF